MRKAALYTVLLVVVVLPVACKKGGCNVIPEVGIQRIPFSTTQYQSLSGQYGSAYLQGGYRGIVVINLPFGFVAFDRCSTVNPDEGCAVEIDEDDPFILIDPCSGATFSVLDGSPTNSIGRCSLKPYRVSRSSDIPGTVCYVTN